jgi:hypothetical protein
MANMCSVKAKALAPSARKWHFGIATCSDLHRLQMSLENSSCKEVAHLSWGEGQGPDCYYMYQSFVVWQGERCFEAMHSPLMDAAFGRGPEPYQRPTIEEISAEEAEQVARNFPKRARGAYISLMELGLPESVRDSPGVEGYASTHCPRWTLETPSYREYISDGFREPDTARVLHYGTWCNFATPPSRPRESYRFRHEGDSMTWAVYFTPGLVRAIVAANMGVA